ncbi:MAG: glucosaminidase domain-containing protein [Prevotella sp.]|nr:glucosaminidase domain-containing protein [Bacteroides sp.]MCM1366802.1 glucosaminidase domain-containing protein [Prevotella sp.]MCM1437476.1 glucosaminidase domain-containing protein [Prevotella sp.]
MKTLSIIITVLCSLLFFEYARADYYSDYIDKYAPIAVRQMEQYGIPASITLAQGLLESAAGRSTLATQGNNHFGIKCHTDWKGDTMLRDDDAPDECFRVYHNPEESYQDHSVFLTKKRYAPLFELDPFDYAGWAQTLKKCGYATDPNYADRLITIIERYALYSYDSNKAGKAHEVAEFIIANLADSHPVRKSRGLHYVIAAPGDTYAKIAKEFKISKKKLIEYNDVSKDGEIRPWQEVYLQEKADTAPKDVKSVTIGEDESIHSVAQRYGMKMKTIMELNPNARDIPGTVLRLR